jgi:hypothetical protein
MCGAGVSSLMRWGGFSRRFGGWLALAALALQMGVSFGHVHPGAVHGTAPSVAMAGAVGQAVRPLPAQHPADDADDYCAICASIFLAATSFAPQAPQLPVPFGGERVEHSLVVAFDVVEPRRILFQSRAPPLR